MNIVGLVKTTRRTGNALVTYYILLGPADECDIFYEFSKIHQFLYIFW
jgi:hypothetical protein